MANSVSTVSRVSSAPRADGQGSLSERVKSLRLQPGGSSARPRSAWLPWGLTVIALATTGVFAARAYLLAPTQVNAPTSSSSSNSEAKPVNSPGAADTATGSPGEVVLDSKGYVIASHQIQLSPQVGGEIIWLDPNFREGAVYKKGDRLAEIDPVIYQAQVKSARAALQIAQINQRQAESGSTVREIEVSKAQLKNMAARLEFAQVDERHKRMAGIGSTRDELEKSQVQLKMDEAGLNAQKETLLKLEVALEEQRAVTRAQVQSAQAALEQAEKQLKNCTILAPTTGIILSKKAELGGYVNPLAFGAAGYLCEMADLRDLEVELDIQERDINRVKPGQHCRIMPDAGQRDSGFLKKHPQGYTGYVSRRMPVANRAKGAITVRVKIEIPTNETSGEFLLPDMGVLVSFLKSEDEASARRQGSEGP